MKFWGNCVFPWGGEGSNRRLISLRRLSLKAHPSTVFFQRETVSLQLIFTLRFKPKSGHLKGRERKIPRLWLCRYPFPGNPQSAYSRCTLRHIDFTTTWDPNAVICIYGKGLYLEHSPAHWQIVGKKKKKGSFLYLWPEQSSVSPSCTRQGGDTYNPNFGSGGGRKKNITTITKLLSFSFV